MQYAELEKIQSHPSVEYAQDFDLTIPAGQIAISCKIGDIDLSRTVFYPLPEHSAPCVWTMENNNTLRMIRPPGSTAQVIRAIVRVVTFKKKHLEYTHVSETIH